MEAVSALDDLAVKAVDSSANTLNLEFGGVAKSGITVGAFAVGDEGRIVIEHDFGSARISAAFNIR